MIKKLQRKFILLSMSALLLVLVVIIAGINIVNYNAVTQEADKLLSIISENKGEFPVGPDKFGNKLPPGMSPEIPYESRYFSVVLDKDSNQILFVETSRIISVDSEEAVIFANTVQNKRATTGFIQNFRYQIHEDDTFIRITFLDCGRKLDAYYSFLFASITISICGYLIVFAFISFFSNRIVQPISESYEKQKRFITDASHEIKTPLTIINADTDILEMEIGENEWIGDIKNQITQLTELTNSLVFLSRMEESEHILPAIDFPFSEIATETTSSFQHLAQKQRKELEYHIPPMLTLCGDEKSIRQLFSILLDNALKYSPVNSKISLLVEEQNNAITICVTNDTLQIIPKDQLKLLFDRFYRMDASRNSQTGGHGVGLSIAKAIVEAHNGKIHASSPKENTLQITVKLPK
ncbi:MAG: HAMP domain-containing histidine kinase [Agathobacter sp.]|nr:HAMP domain-containing histidine kinase [Agathobacter sp.]